MKKAIALEFVLDAANSWRDHVNREVLPGPLSPEELLHMQGYVDDVEAAITTLAG